MPPRRTSKDTPAKLAARMRSWRVALCAAGRSPGVMVASYYVRERDCIFLRWLENVERLLGRHVDRGAAFEAWHDGYSVREYAGEVIAPSPPAEEGWG